MHEYIESPEKYFDLIVTPDFEDFYKDQKNVRKAFHVCLSLDSLVDWVAQPRKRSRKSYEIKCAPHLEIIHAAAINIKHFPPTSVDEMTFGVTSRSQKIDDWSSMDAAPDIDTYGMGPQVVAKQKEGWLLNSISEVYYFWKNRENWN